MATRNLTRKYVDIRNAQKANRVTGFHTNNVRVTGGGGASHDDGEDDGMLVGISPTDFFSIAAYAI